MFYATLDSEYQSIAENAEILAFETEAAARAYLTDAYADFVREAQEDGEPVTIGCPNSHKRGRPRPAGRSPDADVAPNP